MVTMAESLSYSLHAVRIPPPPSPHSPLRSPKRRQQLPAEDDPLLSKLSPEAILDALAAINAVSKHERQAKDLLTRSISQVSQEERALGARAAVAAKRLREWLRELQAWPWPKGVSMQQGHGFVPPSRDPSNSQTEFWGSLPSSLVRDYEARLEQIRDGMEGLNVDELKEHIMNVHVPGRSRPSSAHSALSSLSAPPFTYTQLSDFNAVITATILRALPTLARLNVLLDTWSARLLVLPQIPSLLQSLHVARASLDLALKSTQDPFSTIDLISTREELVQLISVAGSRMDTVLDVLEGRDDSMPEIWIDNMDGLEADFTTWVQRAEKVAIARELRSSAMLVEKTQPATEDRESQHDMPANHQEAPELMKKHDSENDLEKSLSAHRKEAANFTLETNAAIPSISASSRDNTPSHSIPVVDLSNPSQDTVSVSVLNISGVSESSSASHSPNVDQIDLSTLKSVPIVPAPNTPTLAISTEVTETTGHRPEKTCIDSLISIPDPHARQEQSTHGIDINNNQEVVVVKEDPSSTLDTNDLPSTKNPEAALDQEESEIGYTEEMKDLSSAVTNDSNTNITPEVELETAFVTSEEKLYQLPDSPVPTLDIREALMIAEPIPEAATDSSFSPESGIDQPKTPEEDASVSDGTKTSEHSYTSRHSPGSVDIAPAQPISPLAQEARNLEGEKLGNTLKEPTEAEMGDSSILEYEAGKSKPHFDSPTPDAATPQIPEDAVIEEVVKSNLKQPPSKKLNLRGQHLDSFRPQINCFHPDIPVQSIESPTHYQQPGVFHIHEAIASMNARTPPVEPTTQDSTVYFSPGLFSSASDRTIRETGSPQPNSSMLHDLRSFQHSKNASLPLQRFIDDKSDANYPLNHEVHSDSSSSREDSDIPRFRQRSESPPPNVVPRRAVRGPSSRLMRGTISSLNKVVGTTSRDPSDTSNYDAMSERHPSRHRLGSPYDADSDPTPWRRKSSTNDLLQAPRHHLHSQPSMESMSSYVSSNGTGRRRYSFSTDGGSFAIRPVHEADSDLQEKIHSILTSIPGKIRLSNKPANDYDQQSVMSSVSSSKRSRINARSPFSTPSRAGTPTPSEGFASSRQRRATSYKSEDKTVRVYHLHHRGKTEPTKLFVRTVGEDGERVMVRVGGGWADLGEYLREYVLHHGRQTPSNSNVEVKGLPASTSPGSTVSAGTAIAIPSNSPGHASAVGDRPGTSLSVRKTRRTSRPSELPDLQPLNSVETAVDNLPLPSFPLGRRTSVASLNSVSVSSVLGDGSNVYSPHPGSARTPHSASTPLGLAGPKPRTRHVSMTPESEAWVEDVIGQARRTSSNTKPLLKPVDHNHQYQHQINREAHSSSRMSIRSVSDISSGGRNKRATLKGSGAQDRS